MAIFLENHNILKCQHCENLQHDVKMSSCAVCQYRLKWLGFTKPGPNVENLITLV